MRASSSALVVTLARHQQLLAYGLAALVVLSALLPWPELLTNLFGTTGFEPQGDAYHWEPRLLTLHLLTDSLIGLAYVVISLGLIYLAHQARQSIPFLWAFVAFGIFIVSCGLTHFMAAITVWEPVYWLAGGVKYLTAVASVGTAAAIPPLIPRVLALVDSAKLAERNRQLQGALDTRDIFLQIASHELRTPLTTIRASAQYALRRLQRSDHLDHERLERSLQVIDEQSDRLGRLIAQLLDVSRIETGKFVMDHHPVDLSALLRQVADAAKTRTDRHPLLVKAPAQFMLLADPLRLEQVLTNLVDNAIKYSPDGGPIELSLSQPSTEIVEIAVRDHGPGIPSEQRPHIFEQYFQARTGRQRSGLGLGLYICRQIVEAHGGRILVEFPEDGGSRFLVRLPLQRDKLANADES